MQKLYANKLQKNSDGKIYIDNLTSLFEAHIKGS